MILYHCALATDNHCESGTYRQKWGRDHDARRVAQLFENIMLRRETVDQHDLTGLKACAREAERRRSQAYDCAAMGRMDLLKFTATSAANELAAHLSVRLGPAPAAVPS